MKDKFKPCLVGFMVPANADLPSEDYEQLKALLIEGARLLLHDRDLSMNELRLLQLILTES